jgi:hypothetical protein
MRERRSIGAIARELRLNRRTVRRFARAQSIDGLLAKTGSRGALLDPFKAHLHRRLADGITDAAALTAEIRAAGYRGSAQTVRRYVHPFRASRTAPPPVPDPPKVRHLTGWIMTDPDHLDPNDQAKLDDARARCPHLKHSPATSPSSPRSSPACTANASTTGSPRSTPTTYRPCAASPPA